MRIFHGINSMLAATNAGLLNFATGLRQLGSDIAQIGPYVLRAFPDMHEEIQKLATKWVSRAIAGARLFMSGEGGPLAKDYPTNRNLPEGVNYRVNVVVQHLLTTPRPNGERYGYITMPLDFEDRPADFNTVYGAALQEMLERQDEEDVTQSGQADLADIGQISVSSIERRGR